MTMPVAVRVELARCAACGSGHRMPTRADPGAAESERVAVAAAGARADWIAASQARTVAIVGRLDGIGSALEQRGISVVPTNADAVAVVAALERALDPAAVLSDARSRVAPGGTVLLESRNFGSVEAIVDPLVWARPDIEDLRTPVTADGARALMRRAGLTDVQVVTTTSERYELPAAWTARRAHWAAMRIGLDAENVLLASGRVA